MIVTNDADQCAGREIFHDRAGAKNATRKMPWQVGHLLQATKCPLADHFHLVPKPKVLKNLDLQIVQQMALGLRGDEICADLGINKMALYQRVHRLRTRFGAMSNSHLLVILGEVKSFSPGGYDGRE